MSQQYLKLSKNSQSAAVPSKTDTAHSTPYQDQPKQGPNLAKGKSEVQSLAKTKLQRRDLNLIPPSAAIVQSI